MFVHICVWRLWLKTFSISSVQFLQSVCLHLVLSCVYAFCTLCLSSFHHDDHVCILSCLLLSTYSAASSSSLRNFLTRNFLSEEFIKIAYSPPSSRVNALSVILLNSFMMLLKITMREEHMLVGIAIISSFLSMCLKFWSYACVTILCKLILVPTSCLLTKSLCIGSGLDLNVLVIFFMMLYLCFNSYLLYEHHWNHHA